MRYKDKNKIEALQQSVIDVLINEGYHNLSVAKIAKHADVSPATLYIYYRDKKDMLGKVYLRIKQVFDAKLFANVDSEGDVEFQFRLLLHNYADALNAYPREATVMDVFNANSDLIPQNVFQTGIALSRPIQRLYQRGLANHSLRPIKPEILIAYTFQPINQVAKQRIQANELLEEKEIQTLIEMAWQACKAPK